MSRSELLTRYRIGPDVLTSALAGVDLDARPAPSEWNAREIIHHVADAELNRAVRLRRLLTEETPRIDGWEENEYADRLHYDRPIGTSLAVVASVVASNAELIERMSETDWTREGIHAEFGRVGMVEWVERAAQHIHEHAEQIRRCRS